MRPHLVILREDHLGDMILTTPLARALASAGWQVTVVGKATWAEVWENNPHASYVAIETIAPCFPKDSWRLSCWLRQLAPTHVLIPYHHSTLLWASFFSGLSSRYCQMGRILGRLTLHYSLRSGLLHTPRHMGDVCQDFAEAVGVPRQSPQPELFLKDEEKKKAAQRLAEVLPGTEPLVIVNPFHGGNTCHLSTRDYVEIVRLLQNSQRCRIVITGVAREKDIWLKEAAALSPQNVWVSCGKLTLRELFAVVSQVQWLVCGGTGPLHIASALNIPTVGILCANPHIDAVVWGNLTPGAIHLSPPREQCARLHASGVRNCGFCQGPFPKEIVQTLLKQLDNQATSAR